MSRATVLFVRTLWRGALLVAFVGCAEKPRDPVDPDPPGPIGPVPARLIAVSATVTGEAGANVEIAARLATEADAPVPGVDITFTAPSGSGSITANATTDANGVARATWTLPDGAGTHTARASVNWSGGDRTFSASVDFTADVQPPPPIVAARVSAGGGHACYLEANGQAICWGLNGDSELGTAGLYPSQFSIHRTPVEVQQGMVVFEEIASGESHTCALDDAGAAWCWGRNVYGQLGTGAAGPAETAPRQVSGGHVLKRIVAGQHHTCGLTQAGQAFCWGGNFTGQLGDGLTVNSPVPSPVSGNHEFADIAVGMDRSCGVRTDGQAFCWGGIGNQFMRTPTLVPGGLTFVEVVVTAGHACGRDRDGRAHCWGTNNSGQLGDGGTTASATPVAVTGNHAFRQLAVGQFHSCGIDAMGKALCWGVNNYGQLGNGVVSGGPSPVPTPVVGNLTFRRLTAAGAINNPHAFTCGLLESGWVHCWGGNNYGQLGNGPTSASSTPVHVAGERKFAQIETGLFHNCGLEADGTAWCFGNNSARQLDDGTNVYTNLPVAVSGGHRFAKLSGGRPHTCSLDMTGQALCWGDNSAGQLGNNSTTASGTPVAVTGGMTWSMISASRGGQPHTCAVTTTGEVWCWGRNNTGQIGDGTTTQRLVPTRVPLTGTFIQVVAANGYSCALASNGSAFCWGYGQFGSLGHGSFVFTALNPVQVIGGHDFVQLSARDLFTCALDRNGSAWCWGAGNTAALGNGQTTHSNAPVQVGGNHTFKSIVAGGGEISANLRGHTCALDTSGAAWCRGYGAFGQIGDNASTNRLTPVAVYGGHVFSRLSAGGQFTCGIDMHVETRCWGSGTGHFGDGNGIVGSQVPKRIFLR